MQGTGFESLKGSPLRVQALGSGLAERKFALIGVHLQHSTVCLFDAFWTFLSLSQSPQALFQKKLTSNNLDAVKSLMLSSDVTSYM